MEAARDKARKHLLSYTDATIAQIEYELQKSINWLVPDQQKLNINISRFNKHN